MTTLVNTLPIFSEAVVDHIDKRLREASCGAVVLSVHESDPEIATLAAWRLNYGMLQHAVPMRCILDETKIAELDRALEVFVLCLTQATT